MNHRAQFIGSFFNEMEELDYTLLKFTEGDIDDIDEESDLDVLIDKKALPFVASILRGCIDLEIIDKIERNSMTQFFMHFKDGSFLQVDCLFQLIRKNMVYMSNSQIRENTKSVNGVKTYDKANLFEHLVLFNQLNHSGMPIKYIQFFRRLPGEELNEIIAGFNQKFKTNIQLTGLDKSNPVLEIKLKNHLNMQSFNAAPNKLVNTYKYLKDTISSLFSGKGKIITFSGVDGAGKSTILAETRELLEKKFRKKVVVLRHRPSLLPILSSVQYGKKGAEKRAADKLPRQGGNKSTFSSLLRFSYYYLDYFFGQWYIFFRYLMFNYIVLYDRYYFDFIVDGKRSNIQLDSRFTKLLYRFVHKPKLNIFLYASPEVILARKKELTAKDIESLTTNYQNLFANFSDRYDQVYLPIKNIDKEVTLLHIQKELQHIL